MLLSNVIKLENTQCFFSSQWELSFSSRVSFISTAYFGQWYFLPIHVIGICFFILVSFAELLRC